MLRAIAVRLLGNVWGCGRVKDGCCGVAEWAAECNERAAHDMLCRSQLTEADCAVAPRERACVVVITLTLGTGQGCFVIASDGHQQDHSSKRR